MTFDGWLGGNNSCFQLDIKKHVLYVYDMNLLCMGKGHMHGIATKHMVLNQGEWRLAVMVRKIQPQILKNLHKSEQKKSAKPR